MQVIVRNEKKIGFIKKVFKKGEGVKNRLIQINIRLCDNEEK